MHQSIAKGLKLTRTEKVKVGYMYINNHRDVEQGPYSQKLALGSGHYFRQGVGRCKCENRMYSKFVFPSELARYIFAPPPDPPHRRASKSLCTEILPRPSKGLH